jgi:hypothetical protein
MSLLPCGACGRPIAVNALTCPQCGAPGPGYAAAQKSRRALATPFIVLGSLVAAGGMIVACGKGAVRVTPRPWASLST